MHKDRMDELLKDVCQNEWQRIEGLKDIEVPDFDRTMERFKRSLKGNSKHGDSGHFFLRKVRKLGKLIAVTACILICSLVFSILGDMPQVKAWKFNILRTFVEFKDGVTMIKQGNFDPDSVPEGKIPPPPPEFDGEGPAGDPEALRQPPADENAMEPIEKTLTLEQAKKEIPFALLVPEYLPEGFHFKEARSKQFSLEHYIVEQEYADADNNSITIRQHSSVKSFGMGGGTTLKVKSIKVMGEDAILITDETSYCRTSWYKDEFRYEVMADTSEKEFMKLLESLKFTS